MTTEQAQQQAKDIVEKMDNIQGKTVLCWRSELEQAIAAALVAAAGKGEKPKRTRGREIAEKILVRHSHDEFRGGFHSIDGSGAMGFRLNDDREFSNPEGFFSYGHEVIAAAIDSERAAVIEEAVRTISDVGQPGVLIIRRDEAIAAIRALATAGEAGGSR